MIATLVAVAIPAAADGKAEPEITVAKLAGSWQATFVGQDDCGIGSELVTFTLNSGEASSATWQYHTVSCGDGKNKDLSFTIDSLNSDGTGTATLQVIETSKISLSIQVSGNEQVFNLVDITDSNHYKEGTAVKQ
jgi:hypothetical protein